MTERDIVEAHAENLATLVIEHGTWAAALSAAGIEDVDGVLAVLDDVAQLAARDGEPVDALHTALVAGFALGMRTASDVGRS